MGQGYPSREVVETWLEHLESETDEGLKSGFGYAYRCMMAMHDELDHRQDTITELSARVAILERLVNRMATVIGDAWEDLRSYEGINEMLDEAESMLKGEH